MKVLQKEAAKELDQSKIEKLYFNVLDSTDYDPEMIIRLAFYVLIRAYPAINHAQEIGWRLAQVSDIVDTLKRVSTKEDPCLRKLELLTMIATIADTVKELDRVECQDAAQMSLYS